MKSFSTFKVAAAQATPVFLNKMATVDKASRLITEAAKKGAKLILFPEGFIPAYPDWAWVVPAGKKVLLNGLYSELFENSIALGDAAVKKLCAAAKKSNIHVVIGVSERNSESSNASLYNTTFYIGADGSMLGKHRKLVPTGGERLIWAQGDGSTLKAFGTPIGMLGGLICWENYMPLARQAMYNQGVQVYLAPTWDSGNVWLASMQHIAKEGGMYVVSCCMLLNMSDIPDRYEFKKLYPEGKLQINSGNSVIVNPKGEIIAGPLNGKEGILYADINLNDIPASKWILDTAGHYSRTDVFELKVKN